MVAPSAVTRKQQKDDGRKTRGSHWLSSSGLRRGFEERLSEEMIFARVIGNDMSWSVIGE